MFTSAQLHLAKIFLKIFFRNRQSIFFYMLFPLIFTGVFFFSGGPSDPIKLGLVNMSESTIATKFSDLVTAEPAFDVTKGNLVQLKEELIIGDQTAIILIPEDFTFMEGSSQLSLILDASQVRQASSIQETLENSLLAIERDVRGIKPMFNLVVEDVQARPQSCLLYTSPSPRDGLLSRMPSSA